MKYIAGIDIGTTNIKGSLYSSGGKLISHASTSYNSYSLKENYHEQNPDDWVMGFIKVLKQITRKSYLRNNLEAVSISTQGGTVVPVDKNFRPLCNAITWLDRRGIEILSENKSLNKKNVEFYNKTGWRLDSCMSFLPLYWIKERKKNIFNKIFKVMYVNDYVLRKITDTNYHDPSNASITLFYNIKSEKWDDDILDLIGLDKYKFSEVKDSGYFIGFLTESVSKKIGIERRVRIINGGHDQYCSAIGSGILDKSEMLLATGTAWVIFKLIDRALLDNKRFFAIGRHILTGKYGLIYSTPAAGASLKWFAREIIGLNNEQKLFSIINRNKKELSLIKNNIIFYPYLTGAYGPDFDMERKAAFLNIEIGHNNLDLIKAIMEGIGFQLKKILEVLYEKGIRINKIKMVGGGARSEIWPQIIADITNLDIYIPKVENIDFATAGAAIIAGYGSGIFNSIEKGYEVLRSEFIKVKPHSENVSFYEKKFMLFKRSLTQF